MTFSVDICIDPFGVQIQNGIIRADPLIRLGTRIMVDSPIQRCTQLRHRYGQAIFKSRHQTEARSELGKSSSMTPRLFGI